MSVDIIGFIILCIIFLVPIVLMAVDDIRNKFKDYK